MAASIVNACRKYEVVRIMRCSCTMKGINKGTRRR